MQHTSHVAKQIFCDTEHDPVSFSRLAHIRIRAAGLQHILNPVPHGVHADGDVVDLAMMEAAFRAATSRRSRWCFSAAKSNDRPANALRERALIDELGKGDVLERDTE